MSTFLLLGEPFSQSVVVLDGETHHHLFRVKRHQVGDRLRAVDGRGRARWGEVVAADRRSARVALGEPAPANEPDRAVELYVAPPKPERAAWLVEKATELGVAAIRFLSTERDARSLAPSQLARLGRIAIAALEQCERSLVPEVTDAGGLQEVVRRCAEGGASIAVLDRDDSGEAPGVAAENGRLAILVGPEGGWSPDEREVFARLELPRWSLGERILRIETAAVVAAGLVLAGRGFSR